MKKYEIGLYEKAMRNTLSWSEKLGCAKECGYDYMEMCIDATDEKINRIFMNTAEKKEIMEAVFQAGLPIGSMSVSALTKYALGDPDEEIRKKAMQIAEKSIELAVDLGVRTVMIPGYDIYFGEWTIETLLETPASDATLIDFDGDGKDELLVLSPFHGDTVLIYREKDGKYELDYEYPEKIEFLHAIWSGEIQGKPVVMIGHRKGNRDLLKFCWENGQYHAELIDHDCGPANAYGFHKDGKDYVISTNREINEIAMYEFD